MGKNDDDLLALIRKHIQDVKEHELELRTIGFSMEISRALREPNALFAEPIPYDRKIYFVTSFTYKENTHIIVTDEFLQNLNEFRVRIKQIENNQQYL